jgi:hypothetical protein
MRPVSSVEVDSKVRKFSSEFQYQSISETKYKVQFGILIIKCRLEQPVVDWSSRLSDRHPGQKLTAALGTSEAILELLSVLKL